MERRPRTSKDILIEKMAEGDSRADLIVRVILDQADFHGEQELEALADMNIRGTDLVLACIAYLHYKNDAYKVGPRAAQIFDEIFKVAKEKPRLGTPYDSYDKPFRSGVEINIYEFACTISENNVQKNLIADIMNGRKFPLNHLSIRGLPQISTKEIKVSTQRSAWANNFNKRYSSKPPR